MGNIKHIQFRKWWVLRLLSLTIIVVWLLSGQKVFAQSSEESLPADHPNNEPYETERTVVEHALAFPSYLFHWATRPVGWGVKYTEEKFPYWFEGERGPYGFLPLIEIGGEQGLAGGVLLYHDHLFFRDHRARAELLFGSQEYNEVDLKYRIPVKGVSDGFITINAEYENDPDRAYYQNNVEEDRDYASEIGEIQFRYDQQLNGWLKSRVDIGYRDVTIKTSPYENEPEELMPVRLIGNNKLFSLGNRWVFDYKNGRKRTFSGTQYIVGGEWTQSTEGKDLSFLEYYGEIHRFMPIPILPKTRRLGVKAELHKKVNLGSESIPFYELASLGGTRNLRGFPSSRFRAEGTFLITAEYRYPVWDFLDMVLFTDHGQPFNRYRDIALDDFRSSYGFGFHLLSSNGLAFRSEFAFSKEGGRFIISITPNF